MAEQNEPRMDGAVQAAAHSNHSCVCARAHLCLFGGLIVHLVRPCLAATCLFNNYAYNTRIQHTHKLIHTHNTHTNTTHTKHAHTLKTHTQAPRTKYTCPRTHNAHTHKKIVTCTYM